MLPCTLALLPLQPLIYHFTDWGNFTLLSRVRTLYAFQPRIRAMGFTPISETKLSSGGMLQPLPEAICPPIFDRFKMNESHSSKTLELPTLIAPVRSSRNGGFSLFKTRIIS